MKDFPSLLILANQGRLVAYRPTDSGHLELIDSLEPMEGNVKISDLVTDQGESFATDGPGTSGYDSMPFRDELEIRALRQIAGKVEEILEREEPATWGFGAGQDLNEAILELLPDECPENLTLKVFLDLTGSPAAQIRARFEEALHRSGQ